MNQTDPLDEILTTLENVVAHDILLRQSRAKSGRSPKSIHAQAKAAINAEIAKAVREAYVVAKKIAELNNDKATAFWLNHQIQATQSKDSEEK